MVLRTRLGDSRKLAHIKIVNLDMPDSEMVINEEAYSKIEERKQDTYTTCIVNSCQGKVTGVLFCRHVLAVR